MMHNRYYGDFTSTHLEEDFPPYYAKAPMSEIIKEIRSQPDGLTSDAWPFDTKKTLVDYRKIILRLLFTDWVLQKPDDAPPPKGFLEHAKRLFSRKPKKLILNAKCTDCGYPEVRFAHMNDPTKVFCSEGCNTVHHLKSIGILNSDGALI